MLDLVSYRVRLVFPGGSRKDLAAGNASLIIFAMPIPEKKYLSLIAGQCSHRRLRHLGSENTACVHATLC